MLAVALMMLQSTAKQVTYYWMLKLLKYWNASNFFCNNKQSASWGRCQLAFEMPSVDISLVTENKLTSSDFFSFFSFKHREMCVEMFVCGCAAFVGMQVIRSGGWIELMCVDVVVLTYGICVVIVFLCPCAPAVNQTHSCTHTNTHILCKAPGPHKVSHAQTVEHTDV